MVTSGTVRSVLSAVAAALVEPGPSPVVRLDLVNGWGDTLTIRMHTPIDRRSEERSVVLDLRDVVQRAVHGRRARVEVVWASRQGDDVHRNR